MNSLFRGFINEENIHDRINLLKSEFIMKQACRDENVVSLLKSEFIMKQACRDENVVSLLKSEFIMKQGL